MLAAIDTRTIAPYIDLRRGLWIPSMTVWTETTVRSEDGAGGLRGVGAGGEGVAVFWRIYCEAAS
jgi:hypothetical protein